MDGVVNSQLHIENERLKEEIASLRTSLAEVTANMEIQKEAVRRVLRNAMDTL